MSGENSKQELFSIIWLGTEGEKVPEMQFMNQFTNLNEFEEYIKDKINSHLILILSDSISLDNTWLDLPQICVIYSKNFVCLHCRPIMVLFAHTYMKNKQPKKAKHWAIRFCLSYILPLCRKYWFLIGLGCVIGLAYAFPNLGKTGGYIRSEWSVGWGCVIIIFFLS
jgi:hypothetical protein